LQNPVIGFVPQFPLWRRYIEILRFGSFGAIGDALRRG
jgi:hypothetical protein